MTEARKKLYTWNWIGGGYNQTYAHSEEEAIEHANTMSDRLKPNMATFKCCETEREEKAYWDWFPLMD